MPLINPHLEGGNFLWEAGPVGVLLIHGFTATTAEVRLLAKRLHDAGYTTAGPLLPGHGSQPEDLNRCKWKDWACTAEEAYCELSERCMHVIVTGESMGGLMALYLAAHHPEIAGVITYAAVLRLLMSSKNRIKLRLLTPFVPYIPKIPKGNDNIWQGYSVNPLKGVLQLIALQKEVRSLLPKVHQPLMVMQGKLDTTVHPQAPAEIIQKAGSRCKELYWLENTTHRVVLDQELDLVTELTLKFLQKAVELHREQLTST